MNLLIFPFITFAAWFLVLLGLVWIGAYVSKRARGRTGHSRVGFTTLRGALLTLLGSVIGFSFSLAILHYEERKHREQGEADAIRNEYMRANLLPSEDAAKIRHILQRYLEQRILFYTQVNVHVLAQISEETTELQNQLRSAVHTAAAEHDNPTYAAVVAGVNNVFRSQDLAQIAWRNSIPVGAWATMIGMAIGCSVLMGYGSRIPRPRAFYIIPVGVSIAFFLIAVLDSPRQGGIRVHPQNLINISQSLSLK
jgi:hypothetical protein